MPNQPHTTDDFQAIVLAAGKGRRMNSDLPKVLIPLLGRPLVSYVLGSLAEIGITHPIVIIGTGAELVRGALGDQHRYVLQPEQLGSGHAVLCAKDAAQGISRHLVIMCGDSPLFKTETVRSLTAAHKREHATITLVAATLDNPHGYGRILRGPDGDVVGIVEEAVATDQQRAVREINGGCYAFDSDWLWDNIGRMSVNDAGELCLTQMVDIAIEQGRRVIAVPCAPEEVLGVNTPEQLAAAEHVLEERMGERGKGEGESGTTR